MQKLAVIARLHLQLRYANLIQTLQMMEAFQKNSDAVLISDRAREDYYPGRKRFCEILEEFGIKDNIELVHLNNYFNFIPLCEVIRKDYFSRKALNFVMKNNYKRVFTRFERVAYKCCEYYPTVFELHDINSVKNFNKLAQLIEKGKIKILSISNNLKNLLIDRGISSQNIFIYHDGVNLERFQDSSIVPLFTTEKKM